MQPWRIDGGEHSIRDVPETAALRPICKNNAMPLRPWMRRDDSKKLEGSSEKEVAVMVLKFIVLGRALVNGCFIFNAEKTTLPR